jgi:hypothetical protein
MPLPVLEHPTFELIVPSSKNAVRYRPFLVKEEKILLIAQESGEEAEIINAIKQIINNCLIEGEFVIESAPTFDIEYFFMKLRASSVSDVISLTVTDEDDGSEHDVEIDLKEVEVVFPEEEHSKLIEVNETVGMELRYPTFEDLANTGSLESLVDSIDLVVGCISKIYSGEEVFDTIDYTKEEMSDFVDNLPADTFEKMQGFFTNMPKLSHEVKYKVGKKTKKQSIEGLANFL